MKSNRLLELDSLRGIAAMLVVLFHFTLYRKESDYGFRFGVTGVDLFFIISGFVILMTLEKTANWRDFAISRFSRLYPAYWTCVTITFIVILITRAAELATVKEHFNKNHVPGFLDYLANMTMFQYYFRIEDIDGPYWTLLTEMLFYLSMCLVFVTGKLKKIEVIAGLAVLGVAVYGSFLNDYFPFAYKLLRYGFPLVYYFPLFYAGILFYKLKRDGQGIWQYIMLAAALAAQVSVFDDGVRSIGYINRTEYLLVLLVYFSLFTLYVNNKLSFIVNRLTIFLGGISYSLYLIHQFISITVVIPFLIEQFNINFWVAALLIDLPVILLIATLVNRFIEKPSMAFIRDRYKKYRNRKMAVVPDSAPLIVPAERAVNEPVNINQ